MNQILLTENQVNKKKTNKYNNNNSGDMKKIIIFFSIAILVFALLIVGVYAYKISKKDNKGNSEEEGKTITKPELSIEEIEGETEAKIIAKSDSGISKIIYIWNDEESEEVEKNGITNLEEAIEIPEGNNKLTVKIIDQNGQESEMSKEFNREEDTEKPKIEIDGNIGNGKVKIIATDENNGLKYITYQWNDEEATTIEAEEENQTSIEIDMDVKRGENTLIITAVNSLDKEEKIEKKFSGVNKPVIEVTKSGSELYMKITHDMGFRKIEFVVNGQEYIYDENFSGYDAEKQEIEYKFNLVEGENVVIIHAVSREGTDGTEETYRGKCNYTAE